MIVLFEDGIEVFLLGVHVDLELLFDLGDDVFIPDSNLVKSFFTFWWSSLRISKWWSCVFLLHWLAGLKHGLAA
jgi:hypothetical protein